MLHVYTLLIILSLYEIRKEMYNKFYDYVNEFGNIVAEVTEFSNVMELCSSRTDISVKPLWGFSLIK